MAEPLSATRFLAAIRGEGVRVVEVGKWRTHNRNSRGPWGPVHGVMIHHTVTTGTTRSVALCRNGHATLPGPLCHGVIDKTGTVHLVGHGRANHAGSGDDDVLTAVIAERDQLPPDNETNTDGNRHFYGFECINLGDGRDPWPEAQVEAIARTAAGICRAHGWGADSVIGHSEWQPGKVDPRGPIGDRNGPALTMDRIRARVEQLLDADPDDTEPPAPEQPVDDDQDDDGDLDELPRRRVTIRGLEYGYGAYGDHVTAVGRALVAKGHGDAYEDGPGPRWTDADTANYRSWQLALGYHGRDADGVPGEASLERLLGTLPAVRPTVDLSRLITAARTDPPKQGTPVSYEGARVVERALAAEGLLDGEYVDGHFGDATKAAYAAWQRRCGYRGDDADGIPGRSSLAALAARHGFRVVA
jgi:hypothetical protein